MTSQGIYGIAVGVVATFVFHFVLFGVLATRIGLGKLFIDIASAIAGRYAGGPAKVQRLRVGAVRHAVGLVGRERGDGRLADDSRDGSAGLSAPLRRRRRSGVVDRRADHAADHGRAAFLMIEFLNLPYQTIIIAAIVPAFMHFYGVFMQVHFEAKRTGLRGLTPEELPDLRKRARRQLADADSARAADRDHRHGLDALPRGVHRHLVGDARRASSRRAAGRPLRSGSRWRWVMRCCWRSSPASSATTTSTCSSRCCPSCGWCHRAIAAKSRIAKKDLVEAFETGAKYALAVGAAAATVGIVIGVVTLTGVGFKLSYIVTSAAQTIASTMVGDPALGPRRGEDAHAARRAVHDRGRLRADGLRHSDDGELHHHGHRRGAHARAARRAAAGRALLRFLLRRAGRHHAARGARRLRGRRAWRAPTRSRPATPRFGSGWARRWCRSSSYSRRRCCSSPPDSRGRSSRSRSSAACSASRSCPRRFRTTSSCRCGRGSAWVCAVSRAS